ncbi:transporter [Limnochorda pilosa]|uniref:Transporter n=1 Tax=Limnochorda pilosa TaxID=1555112 RepID=A0A0K2SFU2_LIMPI|nr:transporter [Limnochorda pilosa]
MVVFTYVVALFGAACWGIAPIFGKLGLRNVHPADGLAARSLVTLLFMAGWVLLGGRARQVCAISCRDWFFLGAEAFLATLAGDLAYYAALKWGAAGQAAVVLAASPLVTVGLSRWILHEEMHAHQVLGALLVVAGLVLLALPHRA